MNLLPSEQAAKIEEAEDFFMVNGGLIIREPCDCGNHIQHFNGGNYHQKIILKRDSKRFFVKRETTCELVAAAEWDEIELDELKQTIRDNADWL